MTKFCNPPVQAAKEKQKYGPATYQTPVLATQSITPRERGVERGGERGGGVSVASTVQNTPRDRASVTSFQSLSHRKPPAEKEKKWHLKPWDTDKRQERQEDDICAWVKRRTNLESKRGTKKHPTVIDHEHYYPVETRCPGTEDYDQFLQQSLHSRFHPKIKLNVPTPRPGPTLKYTNTKTGKDSAENGPSEGQRTQREGLESDTNTFQLEMDSYREFKRYVAQQGSLLGPKSKSVPDLNAKYNLEQRNKIKRFLKFSNKARRFYKFDEDEDEGYSSKTSSAETKGLSESDNEEGERYQKKDRLSNSMIDLSQLPSNVSKNDQESDNETGSEKATNGANVKYVDNSKVKFGYTHQPTILQIPHPDMKLVRDSARPDRPATSEEVPFSYSRLKRAKEINKCYKIDPTKFAKENSVYNITSLKPRAESPKGVTLVLRKICIQNADQHTNAVMNMNTPPLNATETNQMSRSNSRAGSRAGSAMSRAGSSASRADSRTGSAKSRAHSAASRCSITPQMEFKNRMQQKHARPNHYRDVNLEAVAKSLKEPMWSQEYSLIERHATSYCIGDLLPAMDKTIYTNQFVKGKLGPKHQPRKYHGMAPMLTDSNKGAKEEAKTSKDEGYMLLQNGMDMLTGSKEKPTLGPPPFRPAPARPQIIRNVKVVVRHVDAPRSSPITGKGSYSPIRFYSEKGPRPMMQSPEKETQRKLKEAFSKFYKNRPKEIGKEFRRMQTMWNA